MGRYRITYHMMPDADDIVIEIVAKNYEDACKFAKAYRKDGFSVEEIYND